MVAILAAVTLAAFVVVQLALQRRRRGSLLAEGDTLHDLVRGAEPRWVAGFELPGGLHYHPAHTWVSRAGADTAYVGVDDFARRLLAGSARLKLPAVGSGVVQGRPTIDVVNDRSRAHLLSPVSGEVIAVNPRVKTDPESIQHDSYGRGWLYKVRSPRLVTELANLLHRSLAERWMEDTRYRLDLRLMQARGTVIQDGGVLQDDLVSQLSTEEWKNLADEFLGLCPVALP